MKTQIARGSLAAVFFPVFPVEAGKPGGANGRSPAARPDFPPRLELMRTNHVSIREPAPRDHAALPVSLKDWLASDAALMIRRKGRGQPKTPTSPGLTPVAVRV